MFVQCFFFPFFGCFPKFLDLWVMGSSFEKPRLEQRKLEDKAKIKARFVDHDVNDV